ncbi:MAG: hypothetical protein KAR40_08550 [Candidatus Sabulitectum sp.]|nr:hypothetical protein [Candidatus Sabulitectum sp.]
MLGRRNTRSSVLGTLIWYSLLMFLAVGMDLRAGSEGCYLGIGGQLFAVIFALSFYFSVTTYKSIGEELQSGRIRMWVTAPVSRQKYYFDLFVKLTQVGLVVAVILFFVPCLIFPLYSGYFPADLFLAAFGIIQVTIALAAFSIAGNSFFHNKFFPAFNIVFPIITLIVFFRSSLGSNPAIAKTVCNALFPVGIGYSNVAAGHLPPPSSGIEIIGELPNFSGIAQNIYPFLWSAFLITASLMKLNRSDQ